jgi:hypothetical protein
MDQYDDRNVWKGFMAGLAGGLAGACVMTRFQNLVSTLANHQSSGQEADDKAQEEPATVQAAQVFSRRILGHTLSDSEKNRSGQMMHYAFGTISGGL